MTERTCFNCMNFRTIIPLVSSNGSRRFTDKKIAYSKARVAWCRSGFLTMVKNKREVFRMFKNPFRKGMSDLKTLKEAAASCPGYDGE
jgi:hypothetical protein